MKQTIKTEHGNVNVRGTNRWKEILYTMPRKEDEEPRSYFLYKGRREYLDDILSTTGICGNKLFADEGYHGYKNWTMGSGILIKIANSGDAVQVFYYYC